VPSRGGLGGGLQEKDCAPEGLFQRGREVNRKPSAGKGSFLERIGAVRESKHPCTSQDKIFGICALGPAPLPLRSGLPVIHGL
jgi:hypothetical protein